MTKSARGRLVEVEPTGRVEVHADWKGVAGPSGRVIARQLVLVLMGSVESGLAPPVKRARRRRHRVMLRDPSDAAAR